MNHADVRAYYADHRARQPGMKILYGHPSPRFWDRGPLTVDEIARHRTPDRPMFLYTNFPFCPRTDPPACGFCLFAREDFDGYRSVERYLGALERDLRSQAAAFAPARLDCIYFGGGTPNLLKPEGYARLMAMVREHFEVTDDAEVTLEGVPQLFDDERLHAMAEAGVSRVSVGAQQLKPERLAHSGRKNTAEQVFSAVERAHTLDLSVNVDLVVGWPDQEEDDLVHDLALLVPLRPESIIVHPLNVAGPSPFARQARLPHAQETSATYTRGREWLEARDYVRTAYTDFMLVDPPRGPSETRYLRYYRDMLQHDRLGVGYAANSLMAGTLERPGASWRSVADLPRYQSMIDEAVLPAEERFGFEPVDLRLLYVLKGLEGTPWLRADDYAAIFGGDLERDFQPHWDVLREMGWLDEGYRLLGEGIFYTGMVQRCISEERNQSLRRRLTVGA